MAAMTTSVVRRSRSSYRVARKCVVFFTAICVLPVILVLLVTTDQYMRPDQRRHLLEYDAYANRTYESAVNFAAVEARMAERRQHLKNVCRTHGLDGLSNKFLHRPNSWEFLVNRPHHLVWCNVFKAASTSWMYNFNVLAGYSPKFLKKTKLVPVNLARQKYPRPTLIELQAALNDSISFLIVRHPLERLLSAYRDKIQLSLPLTLHQKLGHHIVAKYRHIDPKVSGPQPRWPTFFEFVTYLLDTWQNGLPTDMHWTPITEFCTPCVVPFDIIAKFETLWEDQKYLIKVANLENIIKPQWKNSVRGKSTSELIESYFKQLTRAQIYKLHNIYRYDFELFNYTLKGYIEHGTDETISTTNIPPIGAT